MTIHIQPDGTLQLPASVLEQLGSNEVELRLEGKTVHLEAARPKRIFELETLEERKVAFAVFLKKIQQSGNPNLPDWNTLRDEIYP
jgi:antitoxin component of MazEF toxin-antitoxin module